MFATNINIRVTRKSALGSLLPEAVSINYSSSWSSYRQKQARSYVLYYQQSPLYHMPGPGEPSSSYWYHCKYDSTMLSGRL